MLRAGVSGFLRSLRKGRSLFTSAVRRGGHDEHHDIGGIPGANLPFNIHKHRFLALKMGMFLASGFSMPFLTMRHQLLKKSGGYDKKPPAEEEAAEGAGEEGEPEVVPGAGRKC